MAFDAIIFRGKLSIICSNSLRKLIFTLIKHLTVAGSFQILSECGFIIKFEYIFIVKLRKYGLNVFYLCLD